MKGNSEKDQEKRIAGDYLTSFYLNIQYLTEWTSRYLNLLIECNGKYGGEFSKLSEQDKEQIASNRQSIEEIQDYCNSIKPTWKGCALKRQLE